MADFQYQEQDDLMADFELGTKVQNPSPSDFHDLRRKSMNIPNYKKILKPTLRSNFLEKTKACESAKKSEQVSRSVHGESLMKIDGTTKIVGAEKTNTPTISDIGFDEGLEFFSTESFGIMLADVQKLYTTKDFSLEHLLTSCTWVYCIVKQVVSKVLTYDEQLNYLSSLALLSYGGSWTFLAAILAAFEAFDSKQVFKEAWNVGTIFILDYPEGHDISPSDIKDTLRKLGLHIAVLITIIFSPSCAEICICVAFASKFSCLIPLKDMLMSTISWPDEDHIEVNEYFNFVDDGWFDLLAVIASNILSLILFGCYPQLITAMYMGYHGVSITMRTLMMRAIEKNCCDCEMFDRFFGVNTVNQFYIWLLIVIMSVWQAISGFAGSCFFLSWLMFFYPVVQVYKVIISDWE